MFFDFICVIEAEKLIQMLIEFLKNYYLLLP